METESSQHELERRIFHLKTLYDLSQEIGFLGGVPAILKNLLMMIIGTFGASCGFVLLNDQMNGKTEVLTQRGLDKEALDLFSQDQENVGKICELTDIQVLTDKDHSLPERGFDSLSSCKIEIWIPLKINKNWAGGIGLGSKLSGGPYTPDDQELLWTLAKQGAVAIENAKLIEQMKKDEGVRANLARYLSPQIVEQIIQNNVRVNLGGDRKVVTVLFSDIRNFTRISETLPPNQLVIILNEYFTEMAAIIFENQGSLDKYIGDAIVAVFGSLIPLENSAEAAVKTSIEMMREMVRLNEKWKNHYGFNMEMGIGINTGEVFLGNIGSPERMEFTVIGDTVNTASRFSGLAKGRQILATRSTRERLDPGIVINQLPPAKVKGKAEEVEVFEISY